MKAVVEIVATLLSKMLVTSSLLASNFSHES